jgi:hypothetical protein
MGTVARTVGHLRTVGAIFADGWGDDGGLIDWQLSPEYGNVVDKNYRESISCSIWASRSISVGGTLYKLSDDRCKEDKLPIERGIETVMKLRPFKYKKYHDLTRAAGDPYIIESGLIAQEVFLDVPELRHIVSVPGDARIADILQPPADPQQPDYSAWGSRPASISYDGLVPYLIRALQEQEVRIKHLEKILECVVHSRD